MSTESEDDASPNIHRRIGQGVEALTSHESVVRPNKKWSVGGVARGAPSLAGAPPCIQGDNEACTDAGSSRRTAEPTDLHNILLVKNQRPTFSPKARSTSTRFPVPHGSGPFPIPLFLVQLWLLDWERQQRLTQATRPLPLHNPSSFCFFSSSLHALASLRSVVDLAHYLAFLRLLQRALALDGVVAGNTQPSVGSYRIAGAGGLAPHRTDAHGVKNVSTRHARPVESSSLEGTNECFPLSLYRCLLALNRGRIKGSFCRTLSSYTACACTGLSQLGHSETHRDAGALCAADGYSHGYGGSLVDLLHELAAESGVLSAKEIYTVDEKLRQPTTASAFSDCYRAGRTRHLPDPTEVVTQEDRLDNKELLHCYSEATKQVSCDAKASRDNSNVVDEGVKIRYYWSILGSAVASSVQALENEWRLSSVLHSDGPVPQHSDVVAMYRDLMRTIQLSADSSCRSAFGDLLEDASRLHDGHIRNQDMHEFLHLLIEETQRECETAQRLQEILKAYLERPSTLNTKHRIDRFVLQRLRERRDTSHDDIRACRESTGAAATTPTRETFSCSPADASEGKHLKISSPLSDEGAEGSGLSSEFISCNGSVWSVIPQSHLKSVFAGTLQESIRCLRCGVCSPERSVPFWCIHVTLSEDCAVDKTLTVRRSSSVTLERLLDLALGPQRLEDVECTTCSVSATAACLLGRLGTSPLLAAMRMHGSAGLPHCVAVEAPRATKALGHAQNSVKDACSTTATRVQLRQHCEKPAPRGPPPSRLQASQGDAECARETVCGRAVWQSGPGGLTVQDVADHGRNAVEALGAETVITHLDDVPGLYSPFWYLPASVVSAWVRVWRLLFRLRRFLVLRGVAQNSASHGQNTGMQTGTKCSACQGRINRAATGGIIPAREERARFTERSQTENQQHPPVPARQNAGLCGSASPADCQRIAEMDEELRSAAGDMWIVERSPKEKLQRLERMPSVLIIQVNALTLTRGGQLHKEQRHCVCPFLLDATFMTRSTQCADPEEKTTSGTQTKYPASRRRATNERSDYFIYGNKNEQREVGGNTNECACSTSGGAAVSGEYGGLEGPPRRVTATPVSDSSRECWCGLYHLYELRAMITHAGTTASAGHFACYRRWDPHAFIPGAAWYLFVRHFLSSISPAAQEATDSDRANGGHADAEAPTRKNHCKYQQHKGGWHQLRHRVRQWLLHAARRGCTKSSFAWISDDCVRPASFAEVQAAQPYVLFYEKVSPSVF